MGSESVNSLWQKGLHLLDEGEFQRAIKVGRKLCSRRHTSGFEILALAYAGAGEKERAVEILEQVVEKLSVWRLWQLLGNYQSDLRQFSKAARAYKQALRCPSVDTSSVHLNIAINLHSQAIFARSKAKAKRLHEKASAELDLVTDPCLKTRVRGVRLGILVGQEEFEKAMRAGEKLVAGVTRDVEGEVRASILTDLANAYRLGRGDTSRAAALAWDALKHCNAHRGALWLLREIENQVSPNAKYFRLLIEGDLPQLDQRGRTIGFFMTFDVVSETPDEALGYVRRFESAKSRASLRIHQCDELEARPRDRKGVYHFTAHCCFPRRRRSGRASTMGALTRGRLARRER